MTTTASRHGTVLGIGEPMALFEAVPPRRLEDGGEVVGRVAGAEMNALIAVARLGGSAALATAVGDDSFGRLILRTLTAEGVDTSHVAIDPVHPTGVFFKDVTTSEQRRVYYYRAGSAAAAFGEDRAAASVTVTDPEVLVVSGLTLGLGTAGGLGDAARRSLMLASERDITVVFDANLRPGLWHGPEAASELDRLAPVIDVLLAGRDELEELYPDEDPMVSADRLLHRGCHAIVVKNGERGAVCVDADGLAVIPVVRVDSVVDPVGAGDAFAGAVAYGLAAGWPLPDAARLGSALGAAAVASTGDWEGLPSGQEARGLVARHRPGSRNLRKEHA